METLAILSLKDAAGLWLPAFLAGEREQVCGQNGFLTGQNPRRNCASLRTFWVTF